MKKNERQFDQVTYDDFKKMAKDPSLSVHEKIGFPDSYREGSTQAILQDVQGKLPELFTGLTLDIGCGCGEFVQSLIQKQSPGSTLVLIDSEEMLSEISDPKEQVTLLAGEFPQLSLSGYHGRVNSILLYSVLQYIDPQFDQKVASSIVSLLQEGGRALLGDLPNKSMRRRFLNSNQGKEHHYQKTGKRELPSEEVLDQGSIDDQRVMSLVSEFRTLGCHAYLLPQAEALPFSNRREDILVVKP